jgi:hypothetical protein
MLRVLHSLVEVKVAHLFSKDDGLFVAAGTQKEFANYTVFVCALKYRECGSKMTGGEKRKHAFH